MNEVKRLLEDLIDEFRMLEGLPVKMSAIMFVAAAKRLLEAAIEEIGEDDPVEPGAADTARLGGDPTP